MSKLSKIMYLLAALGILALVLSSVILRVWMPFMWILIACSVLFVCVAIFQDRILFREFFFLKTTKKGMSMGASIILAFIFAGALNFLGARHSKSFDFSIASINSLAPQSVQILRSLQSDLKIIYFYKDGSPNVEANKENFVRLVGKYQEHSSFVKLDFFEVNQRPALAEKYEVKTDAGAVFIEYEGRRAQLEKIDEQEVTNGIIKVLRADEKVVYFVIGHGERDFESTQDSQSLGLFKQLLTDNRYLVKSINLNDGQAIPDDASLVAMIASEQPILDFERVALETYLKKGGSLLFAAEQLKGSNLDTVSKLVGLRIKNDYVVSLVETPLGKIAQTEVRNFQFSTDHKITQPFDQQVPVAMTLPTSIEKDSLSSPNLTMSELMTSGPTAFAFLTNDFKGEPQAGPFTFAWVSSGRIEPNAQKDFKAVVVGDADLFSNKLLYQGYNRDFALNSVAFLAGDDELISIAPKNVSKTEFSMTPMQFTGLLIGVFAGLPLVLMVSAGALWYRRKFS